MQLSSYEQLILHNYERNSYPNIRWYALQCLSNHEDKVKRYLAKYKEERRRVCKCLKEVLVPIETVSEVKNGKKMQRDRKFYPGYVFVEMKLFDRHGMLSRILGTKLKERMELSILLVRIIPTPLRKMKLVEYYDKFKTQLERKYPRYNLLLERSLKF